MDRHEQKARRGSKTKTGDHGTSQGESHRSQAAAQGARNSQPHGEEGRIVPYGHSQPETQFQQQHERLLKRLVETAGREREAACEPEASGKEISEYEKSGFTAQESENFVEREYQVYEEAGATEEELI